jgi:hypothetical protein
MTDEELVKYIYPEAIIIDGWETDKFIGKFQVRGIRIKENKKDKWLVFDTLYYDINEPDFILWRRGAITLEKKMLKKLES